MEAAITHNIYTGEKKYIFYIKVILLGVGRKEPFLDHADWFHTN